MLSDSYLEMALLAIETQLELDCVPMLSMLLSCDFDLQMTMLTIENP